MGLLAAAAPGFGGLAVFIDPHQRPVPPGIFPDQDHAPARRAAIDLAFSIEHDTWNGDRYLQLSVADFRAPER